MFLTFERYGSERGSHQPCPCSGLFAARTISCAQINEFHLAQALMSSVHSNTLLHQSYKMGVSFLRKPFSVGVKAANNNTPKLCSTCVVTGFLSCISWSCVCAQLTSQDESAGKFFLGKQRSRYLPRTFSPALSMVRRRMWTPS